MVLTGYIINGLSGNNKMNIAKSSTNHTRKLNLNHCMSSSDEFQSVNGFIFVVVFSLFVRGFILFVDVFVGVLVLFMLWFFT